MKRQSHHRVISNRITKPLCCDGINNMKNKKIPCPKSNRQIVKIGKTDTDTDTHNTQIHNRSLSWLGTGVSITRDGVKLF